MKRILTWLVALAVALSLVLWLPEAAIAFMVIPVVALTQDPYVSALLAVMAGFAGLVVLYQFAEVAVIAASVGVIHIIDRWRLRVALRRAWEVA